MHTGVVLSFQIDQHYCRGAVASYTIHYILKGMHLYISWSQSMAVHIMYAQRLPSLILVLEVSSTPCIRVALPPTLTIAYLVSQLLSAASALQAHECEKGVLRGLGSDIIHQ